MNIYDETKFILKKYGITANKSLGQNFLINDEVIEQIVSGAEVNKEDLIIEGTFQENEESYIILDKFLHKDRLK